MVLYVWGVTIRGGYEDVEEIERLMGEHLNFNENDVKEWLGEELAKRVEIDVD